MDCILPEYRLSEGEYKELWDKCIFVLDTSVLFNIYCYHPKMREEIITILTQISEKLWIPYQVAKEYYDNKSAVITKELDKYEKIKNFVSQYQRPAKIEIEKDLKKKHTTASEIFTSLDLEKKIEDLGNEYEIGIKKIKEDLEKYIGSCPNREELEEVNRIICSLFEGKVGKSSSIEELEKICNLGSKRYELLLPPGYKDKDKNGIKKYGDLIIWFQIIDFAKEKCKHIIFICDDLKDDWWWRPSDTILGPRPELFQEFVSETKQLFYMYTLDRFMYWSNKYIDTEIKDDLINDAKEYRVEEEERLKEIEYLKNIAQMTYIGSEIAEDYRRVMFNIPNALGEYMRVASNTPNALEEYMRVSSNTPNALEEYMRVASNIPNALEDYRRVVSNIPNALEEYRRVMSNIQNIPDVAQRKAIDPKSE